MQEDHIPSIGPRFWVAFTIATVFGANLGDLSAAYLPLGFTARMLVFAALLAAIFIGERYDRSRTAACYWMAVVVIQAASTKLADFSAIDLGFGRLVLVGGLVVLIVASFWILRSHAMLTISTHMVSRPGAAAKPLADTAHWTALVLASTLGATGSDFLNVGLGLGPFYATMILAAVLVVSFRMHSLRSSNRLFMYWLTSTVIRAFGTAVGDFLAKTQPPAGLPVGTALSGALLVALLLLWPRPRLRS